ncbi:hypothetical protein M1N17_00850 [Dehalococcoidia bacterium]|nr:hypothetical protein [Dehalococcoidia bacterium]
MPLWRFITLVVLGTAATISLATWFFPTVDDFRTENEFWNGLQEVTLQYDINPIKSFNELLENSSNSLLIVIPEIEPTTKELDQLNAYVENGGILLLANDYGAGNVILRHMDVLAEFSNKRLLDPLINAGDPRLPLATEIVPSPLTKGVKSLSLNHASSIEGDGLIKIARSSSFSFLDIDNDEFADGDEPRGPFTVLAQTRVGGGELILLSDPSLLINSMVKSGDNAVFLGNLTKILGEETLIFIDEMHLSTSTTQKSKLFLVNLRAMLSEPLPITLLISILTISLLYPTWRKKGAPVWTKTP